MMSFWIFGEMGLTIEDLNSPKSWQHD